VGKWVWCLPSVLTSESKGIFKLTSEGTSHFNRPATRIWGSRKFGKCFCTAIGNDLVEMPPSSFITQIVDLDGYVNWP